MTFGYYLLTVFVSLFLNLLMLFYHPPAKSEPGVPKILFFLALIPFFNLAFHAYVIVMVIAKTIDHLIKQSKK